MRRTLTCVAMAVALLCGCKSEQAAPGAVKLVVEFRGFRPECVRITAWDADAPDRRSSQPVRPASVMGPLQTAEKLGELTVAVFRGADWGHNLGMSAEGFEKGACDAQGNPLAGRQPVAVVESGTVVTQDGALGNDVRVTLSALDSDGDGYVVASGANPGTDCEDARASAYPGAEEVCNGLDDNCDAGRQPDDGLPTTPWYLDEDGDGYGATASRVDACQAPGTKYIAEAGDCLDTGAGAASSHPGAAEVCDGLDNNCDPDHAVDEGFDVGASCAEDDICQGRKACTADGKATSCQGETFKKLWYADADGDEKHGGAGVFACEAPEPTGYSEFNEDCDDGDPFTHDGAQEICDGRDNDCSLATSDSSVCTSGGGSFVSVTTEAGDVEWRSVATWGRGGVWMVGRGGNWARKAAGASTFSTGTCEATDWYSLWIDPASGGSAYYVGDNRRLAIQTPDDSPCVTNPPTVDSTFNGRGLLGIAQPESPLRIHGVGVVSSTTGNTFTWNGTNTTVALASTATVPLRDIHGTDEGPLFAVGDVENGQFPIYKFNAATDGWEPQSGPAGNQDLQGVYVVSSKLAYAVGEGGRVLKWNGVDWQLLPTTSNSPTGTLRSVLAFGESSVYVTSQSGTVHRYNGSDWETLLDLGGSISLYDIAGTGPDDIWVVGVGGRVYHWPQ